MQLFITEYKKKDQTVVISDIDLLSQLRKVLRASIGDIIWIQSPGNEAKKIRYEVRIEVWDNTTLKWTILSEQTHESTSKTTWMIVAMPNKRDKAELIVQKLTECGLNKIFFWPSERSVIKEWNSKKEERLQKIIKEAVEQSWWRTIPELHFTNTPTESIGDTTLIIFDKSTTTEKIKISDHTYGLIWPEGWLTPRDYQIFEKIPHTIYGLWETVLRMETAAIVGWRLLKNR